MRARKVVAVMALIVAAVGAAAAGGAFERIPDGPQPIAWDREACGHCRMHVGEPAFAAQAIDADGRAVSFDDPGCLLSWLAGGAARARPARVWVHHVSQDRWLPLDRAAFVPVPRSPMGYGLGAVDAGTPGALSVAEATARSVQP